MNRRERKRRGFTLAEAIAVVAIIVVLAGIAVPSILTIQRNLKLTELNSAARSIFVAAQNRMSELRLEADLSALGGLPMPAEPDDYPDTLEAWTASEYFCLAHDDPSASKLLPPGSIESKLASGYFYIEYNAKTGMVYGVFFSDEPFAYSADLPREKSGQRAHKPMLGYFGGAAIDFNEIQFAPIPDFTIVNEEELYILLTARPELDYAISVSDGTAEWTYSTNDWLGRPYHVTESAGTFKILLDSLSPGYQFQTLFPSHSPGENLTVTITASGDNKVPTSASDTANSLFALVDPAGETATLTYNRHLQNLHPAFSGLHENISSALLGGNLDWDTAAVTHFVSIKNDRLLSFLGQGNEIRGLNAALFDVFRGTSSAPALLSDTKLVNARISTSGYVSQSRGTLANTAEHVLFTNCQVYADGSVTAGTCTLSSNGTGYTGGLIGLATDCVIQNSFAALTRLSASAGSVGGLVGGAVNTTISRSYASTGVWSTTDIAWNGQSGIFLTWGQRAGGFIGNMSGGSVSTCYAVGNINTIFNTTAAGFAGRLENGASAQNNYCVTTFEGTATQSVYGFAHLNGGTLNTATCYYFITSRITNTQNGTGMSLDKLMNVFPYSSDWENGSASTSSPYGRAGQTFPYRRLSDTVHYGDWPDVEIKGVLYYYEKYADGTLGYFPRIEDKPLRGDVSVQEDGYLLILETNAPTVSLYCGAMTPGGSSQLTTFTADNAWETIPDKTVYPVTSAILNQISTVSPYYEIKVSDKSYYFNPHFAKSVIETPPTGNTYPKTYEVRTARHLYMLATKWNSSYFIDHYFTSTYIQSRDIDFSTYGGDPLVSMPMGSDGRALLGTYDGGGYSIQMTSLSRATYVGLFGDVGDGGIIKNTHLIGAPGAVFSATGNYAGGIAGDVRNGGRIEGCSVKNLRIEGSQNVGGLFGNSGTTAEFLDCSVENVTVNGAGSSVGGFGGRLLGQITNCTAQQVTVTSSSSNVGGFVGLIQGDASSIVTNCAVAGATVDGDSQVGGFAGYNNGIIRNSAAANASFFNNSTGGSVSGGSAIGGFVGINSGGTIEDCYSIVRYASPANYGFFDGNNGTVRNSYSIAMSQNNTWMDFGSSGTLENCTAFNGSNQEAILSAYASAPWGSADAAHSFPYDPMLQGRTYPFPAVVKNAQDEFLHLGNWPEELTEGLYYYEKYDDNSYGLYADFPGEGVIDTLRNDLPLLEDGYLYLTSNLTLGNISARSVELLNQWERPEKGSDTLSPAFLTLAVDPYACYFLSPDTTILRAQGNAQLRTFYLQLSLTAGGETLDFYFNPNFAKCVINPDNGVLGSVPPEPALIELRSARQLTRMSDLTNDWTFHFGWERKNYVQTRDIDFDAYANALSSHTDFYPIGMSRAFDGSYEGNGFRIIGASVDLSEQFNNSSNGIGLFGTIEENGHVKNLAFLSGAGDCVKTNATASNTDAGFGAFVGINRGTVENCATAGFVLEGVGGFTGGFVGRNEGSIRNCSASNAKFDGQSVGGSIDYASGYAGVGGFAGENLGTITNSYAHASFVTEKAPWISVGAFVGRNTGTIDSAYAATVSSTGVFLDSFSGTTGVGELTYCLTYRGDNAEELQNTFTGGDWGAADAAQSYAYHPALQGMAYPFPAVVQNAQNEYVHYGNWPEAAQVFEGPAGLYYYEEYIDGSLGFYAEFDGVPHDSLDDQLEIVADGYAFVMAESADIYYCHDGWGGTQSYDYTRVQPSECIVKTIAPDKTAYLFTDALVANFVPNNYTQYYELKVGNRLYFFTPDFANTAHNPGATGITVPPTNLSTPKTYTLRTARQLSALGLKASDLTEFGSYRYQQTRDIDFTTTYGRTQTFRQLYSISTPFSGSYDGGGHSITILGLQSSGSAALFGALFDANVSDIHLIGAEHAVISSDNGYVGGLAGYVYGNSSISRCSVTNLTVSGNGSFAGGLVGYMPTGSIEACTVTNVSVRSTTDAVGGLVGCIESATISNCKVLATADTSISVEGRLYIGGFLGLSYGGSIQDCHVAGISVLGSSHYVGGFVGNNRTTIRDCSVEGTGTTSVRGQEDYVGGFVGTNGASILHCDVSGIAVSGHRMCGDFYGSSTGAPQDCTVDGEPI